MCISVHGSDCITKKSKQWPIQVFQAAYPGSMRKGLYFNCLLKYNFTSHENQRLVWFVERTSKWQLPRVVLLICQPLDMWGTWLSQFSPLLCRKGIILFSPIFYWCLWSNHPSGFQRHQLRLQAPLGFHQQFEDGEHKWQSDCGRFVPQNNRCHLKSEKRLMHLGATSAWFHRQLDKPRWSLKKAVISTQEHLEHYHFIATT